MNSHLVSRLKINDIEYHLPKKLVSNDILQGENPLWNMDNIAERTGVRDRYIAAEDETALDLAYEACKKLFSKPKNNIADIDALIFCTQSQDYIMPPNSTILHQLLNLNENVVAFDFNLACSGYIYGLFISQGFIGSGMRKNVLLVTADTYSKFINKRDRSTRVLFGDGAAATILTVSDDKSGLIDIDCCTSGFGHEKFIIPAGCCRMPKSEETQKLFEDSSGNQRCLEDIRMDGIGMLAFANTKIPNHIKKILNRNNLNCNDIDLFVFHQASKMVLDSMVRLLGIDPKKAYVDIHRVGNLVSTSIPVAIKHAMEENVLKKGNLLILSGYGVGLSWGTAVYEV